MAHQYFFRFFGAGTRMVASACLSLSKSVMVASLWGFESLTIRHRARLVESVDALASEASPRKRVRVRISG